MSREKKNLRRLSVLVTAQTAGNLKKADGYGGLPRPWTDNRQTRAGEDAEPTGEGCVQT